MSSAIVAIVEGVKVLLQTESDALGFVREFVAERVYDTELPLNDKSATYVHVTHEANETTIVKGVRGRFLYTVPVRICVRKAFGPSNFSADNGVTDAAEIDELMELTEQICEFVDGVTIANVSGSSPATANGPANLVTISPENYIRVDKQFFSLSRVAFIHYKA